MKQSIFSLLLMLVAASSFAQNGFIRGSVIDNSTGEALLGVTVLIKDTFKGASTDLDGKFSLEVAPGNYTLQVSYISYQTKFVENIVVTAGQPTVIGSVRLSDVSLELDVAVVSVDAVRSSESAIMTMKKKSATIMDGISATSIRMVGDATAVEAAKRVTGVSIEDGKYIYVRGLGDRYTKIMLNNVDIPGLDPDKNSLQMDIFPTNLIDNITVSKNFTAELPADFTGGVVNVETKDFPDERIFNVSIGTSFNPQMHFNSNFLGYEGGRTDFLGFDDGTRELPALATSDNIPTPTSGASSDEVNSFVRSFNPQLGAERQTSFIDYNASVTYGNQLNLGKKPAEGETELSSGRSLGYIMSLSYRTDYKFYDDVFYGEYQRFIDPYENELRYATIQEGEMGERQTLIGALAGLAYKSKTSKIRLTAMRLQSGESRAAQFNIDNDGEAVGQSGYIAFSNNLEYNERSLSNILLNGTHTFDEGNWEIDWRISPTFSTSSDPDIRRTAVTIVPNTGANSFSAGAGGNPSRIWRSLTEINNTSRVDLTRRYTLFSEDAKLKFGSMHTFKAREYEILFFDIQFFGNQSWANDIDPNEVLNPENLYPAATNNIYYQSGNNNPNPNQYESSTNNTAFYVSNEFSLLRHLKTVVGLRAEYFVQRHTGRDQRWASGDFVNGNNLDNEVVLEALDLFPTVNFIYALTENQNLRLAYGKTIARPSFKELSFAQILDPITNRIFNGSLFTYADWDGNLTETRIQNFDLRWERFGNYNQLLSVSAFYKLFDNPIELVRIPEQQTSTEFQPRNVGDGQVLGIELELRKNLEFISPALRDFNLVGNFTLVRSLIDMTDIEYNSRKTYEKIGETISRQRAMAGQAPYVINLGLNYMSYDNGITTGLFYNVKGETLYIVGAGLFPDVYFEPFHSLNFSFAKKFGKNDATSIDFRVSNILNDNLETFYQSFEAEPQVFSRINPGRAFSIGLSHSF